MVAISTAIAIVKPYLVKGGVALGVALAVGVGYWAWHSSVFDEGYDTAMAEVKEENAKARAKLVEYIAERQQEVEEEYKDREERILNATKIYAQHWAELSLNPIVINSVRVRTIPTACNGDAVSGGAKAGSGKAQEDTGTYEARLSEGATRSVNEVMNAIDELKLECELAVNMMP